MGHWGHRKEGYGVCNKSVSHNISAVIIRFQNQMGKTLPIQAEMCSLLCHSVKQYCRLYIMVGSTDLLGLQGVTSYIWLTFTLKL